MIADAPPSIGLEALAMAAGMLPGEVLHLATTSPADMPSSFRASGVWWFDLDESKAWLRDLQRARARKRLRPRDR